MNNKYSDIDSNMLSQQKRDESEEKPSPYRSLVMWVCVIVAATVATLAVSSSYQRSKSMTNTQLFAKINAARASSFTSDLSSGWQVYKVTSSVSNGTYSDIATFMNDYFAYTTIVNLGCSTEKVAASLFSPFELHFVDSGVFNDLKSRSIEDWAAFADTLSVDSTYNAFFHNKVQMYVDELQPHFDTFTEDNIPMLMRLSSSTDGTTDDVAHIGIWFPNAITMLELVGPSSSLDSDSLSSFTEWSDVECPASHVLQMSLTAYEEAYTRSREGITATQESYESSTGLRTPMGIQVSIPTSSMTSMGDTIDLVTSMNGASVAYNEYSTGSQSCSTAGFTVGSIYVTYVENDALNGLTSLSIADWESDIMATHDEYVNSENTMESWDRYLDSHIGMYVDAEDSCDSYYDYIADNIADNSGEFQYGLRVATTFGVGTHYYTGTDGVRSWEFNANDCAMGNSTDICGCSNMNSRVIYEEQTGMTKCAASDRR